MRNLDQISPFGILFCKKMFKISKKTDNFFQYSVRFCLNWVSLLTGCSSKSKEI